MIGSMFQQARTSVMSVETRTDVTAVLVLTGLPRDLTSSILAHEAFHVWCSLSRRMPTHLPLEVEEGLAQLMSAKFVTSRLEHEGANAVCTEEAPWAHLLLRYLSYQIETNPDPVYGEGFRRAAACDCALGLPVLLELVAETQQFPPI